MAKKFQLWFVIFHMTNYQMRISTDIEESRFCRVGLYLAVRNVLTSAQPRGLRVKFQPAALI